MKWHADGRMYAETMTARAVVTDEGITLKAPAVGLWRGRPAPGSLVTPGASIGQLEVLGVLYRLVAPTNAAGLVLDTGDERRARVPVDARTVLLTLDPNAAAAGAVATGATVETAQATHGGLVFRAPLSGRYYARPAPDEPAFVTVGDVITEGQSLALLEVMKTFNRVTYGGQGLPTSAKVVAIVPADGDDIEEDDVLLRLEPA